MKDRIKQIRKSLGLNQAEFGKRVGVKGNTIGNYEIGLRTPSDAVIFSICREFHVSEEWLRTGAGEPFVDLGENEQLSDLFTHMEFNQDDPVIRMITAAVRSYYNLSDSEKAAVQKLLDNTLADLAQKNAPET